MARAGRRAGAPRHRAAGRHGCDRPADVGLADPGFGPRACACECGACRRSQGRQGRGAGTGSRFRDERCHAGAGLLRGAVRGTRAAAQARRRRQRRVRLRTRRGGAAHDAADVRGHAARGRRVERLRGGLHGRTIRRASRDSRVPQIPTTTRRSGSTARTLRASSATGSSRSARRTAGGAPAGKAA